MSDDRLSPEIQGYYRQFDEAGRLRNPWGGLEFKRTRELLVRYLPPPPAVVLDIGGGPGAYLGWLGEAGYTVVDGWVRRLVDIARRLEGEPSLLGVSAHLLAIAVNRSQSASHAPV